MAVLLETLRPGGVLGDANDFTYESFFGVAGSLIFSRVALGNFIAGGVVEFVVFKMRVSWHILEQGPSDAEFYIEWYEGPGGAGLNEGLFIVPTGADSAYTFASSNQTLDRQGQPWSLAVLNSLEMRGYADVSDGGSQIETEVRDIDVWAELWGAASGGPLPKVRASGVVNKLRGGGILSAKRSAAGVVNKVRASGVLRVTED